LNMQETSWAALLLLLVLSAVMGVRAQGKNGMVSATVLDQHKGVLRGASVTLTNVDTKAVQKCVSNEKGECKFEVPAGAYDLTTELDRFCPLKVSDVRLKENETVPVELKLDPVIWKNPGAEYENLLKALGNF
jgi:carboxypeptidase family protein